MLLFFRNETGFRRQQRLHRLQAHPGLPMATPEMRMTLFVLSGAGADRLLPDGALPRQLSKFGRVLQAIRDAESRVMFTGYNPLAYKLSIWTLSR
jgi:urea transport system permease protein